MSENNVPYEHSSGDDLDSKSMTDKYWEAQWLIGELHELLDRAGT